MKLIAISVKLYASQFKQSSEFVEICGCSLLCVYFLLVRCIDFQLVSCEKPLKLKFVSCSLEDTAVPFRFLDKGFIGKCYISFFSS